MTGMYPARLHLTDFIAGQNRPFAKMQVPDWTKQLAPDRTTVAERLKNSGYRTGHIGKWHLSGPGKNAKDTAPTAQGFDFSYERPQGSSGYLLDSDMASESGSNYLTDLLTDKACQFIDQSKSEPFFLYFAYHVPHTPIEGRQDLVEYFERKVDFHSIHRNPNYAAMVASLDQSVGRIVAELEKHQLTNNSVIVFISDNGGLTERYGKHEGFTDNFPLRRGKGSAYEGGVRVPAIICWPGFISAGSRCETPVMTMDLFPTFCEIAGVEPIEAGEIDGRSLMPLFRDASIPFDRDLFWHYPHYHAGGDGPYSAIRSGNYRLIEFHEDQSVRLYDLAADIGERNDLSVELVNITAALRQKLHDWRQSVSAQMPMRNPDHDPARELEVLVR